MKRYRLQAPHLAYTARISAIKIKTKTKKTAATINLVNKVN